MGGKKKNGRSEDKKERKIERKKERKQRKEVEECKETSIIT